MARTLIEYEPRQIITTGNKTYQADQWGVLRPVAQSKTYRASRKAQMMKKLAQMEQEAWEHAEACARARQDRAIRENIPEMEISA
jgi:hypothetical protein